MTAPAWDAADEFAPPPDDREDAYIEQLENEQAEDDRQSRVEREADRIRVREEARRKVAAERNGAVEPPAVMSLAAFLKVPDPAITYRIDYLWPIGGRVILAAQYKAGKTTMVGNIVRSLADGQPFLTRYAAQPARVTVIDDELDERTLRIWIRDQDITHHENVQILALRGRTATFDILDPHTRSQWADRLRGTQVLILDCLRPILDSLGLSEDKDAGRFLVAFDALLHEAGIEEALVVHHMGHAGERSRGDSRILDWPDATWKLVRETPDDPASARYFSAFGRDVNVHECRLGYDQQTRRLDVDGGGRKDAIVDDVIPDLIEFLTDKPDGVSKNQIETALLDAGHSREPIRDAIKKLLVSGRAVQGYGPRNSKPITLIPSSPEFAASSPANTASEFASSPLGASCELTTQSTQSPTSSPPANSVDGPTTTGHLDDPTP